MEEDKTNNYNRRLYGLWGGAINWAIWGFILALKFAQHPVAFLALTFVPATVFYAVGRRVWHVKNDNDTGFPYGCLIYAIPYLLAGIGIILALHLWDKAHPQKQQVLPERIINSLF
jgi:hypothetical protein